MIKTKINTTKYVILAHLHRITSESNSYETVMYIKRVKSYKNTLRVVDFVGIFFSRKRGNTNIVLRPRKYHIVLK